MDGLDYTIDERNRKPTNLNRRQFKTGWNHSRKKGGKNYSARTLETLTWRNLGYRLGVLLDKAHKAPEPIQDKMYEICVTLQREQRTRQKSSVSRLTG